ncbi:translation elongation factor 4 [Haliangium ochraceum]|uniref:Elongation factor 4 n=1 Tax=Haliangium ochraceum (strain DSM 14365 / JCM 11303 / SMP-2) TaxID=502025 RepID=D0LYB8_HALO1|nr:translation elongation factor 4 [Haliangium ochraceum]ACY16268.1 GTP-binding protein LepA [Haliangium ochraceum DSM 14365]
MSQPKELIRNFSIIAHIDHGKTTLADRIMESTNAITDREKTDQLLDKMDLERERGITIKAQAVRLMYEARDGKTYQLNLIDTPGHVDFHYEVSRSLAACEGAILVVDAAQGVEAQTLANVYLALDNDLEIVPCLNKIDLPVARPDEVKEEIEDTIGLDASDALLVSAKTGQGIIDVLEAIVARIPAPTGRDEEPLKALIFDSWYDSFKGVVVLLRVVEGRIRKGQKLRFMATKKVYECNEMAVFSPYAVPLKSLGAGEVGIVMASIKDITHARVGDTVTDDDNPCDAPLAGFKAVKPMVFAGLFPVDAADYEDLKEALAKLTLNDAAVSYEPETSAALGFGFRCGFLGLLHMEIIQERLEREHNIDLITTAPSVRYRLHPTEDEVVEIDNPAKLPDLGKFKSIEEPVILATVHVPAEYVGPVMQLCEERRGTQKALNYGSGGGRVQVVYEMPMAEVVFGFYDRLKTLTRGYASLDYEPAGYREALLVRLDVLVNGEKVDALSTVAHRDHAQQRGQDLCVKMKEVVPRQMYDVAIQAAIGSRVITRVTVKAMRKDVTSKCYGGDISRKRKLLEKQKKGKRRMKALGSVELPQEAFLTVLRVD